jgi:hypothetical protein
MNEMFMESSKGVILTDTLGADTPIRVSLPPGSRGNFKEPSEVSVLEASRERGEHSLWVL